MIKDPLKRYCVVCGKQFGSFHQNFACQKHQWEEHGIPGEGKINGHHYKFGS